MYNVAIFLNGERERENAEFEEPIDIEYEKT